MKIAATASYSAVPSMLIVAPIGITKRTTLGSISFFSSRQLIEIGRVALLEYKCTIITMSFEHL
jgi:hypothetical protein